MSRAISYTFDDLTFQYDASKYMLKRGIITRAEHNRTIRSLNDEQDKRETAERLRQLAIRTAEAEKRKAEKRKAYNEKRKDQRLINKNTVLDLTFTNNDTMHYNAMIEPQIIDASNKLVGVSHVIVAIDGQSPIVIDTGKEKDGLSIFFNFIRPILYPNGTDGDSILSGLGTHRIKIVKSDIIPSKKILQSFRDGEKHCVLDPLIQHWLKMAEASESDASKKRLHQIVRKLQSLEAVYQAGVPEDKMDEIGKVIRRSIVLHDVIGNVITTYNPSSSQEIHFTNTRKDHIETGYLTMDKNYEIISSDQMATILEEHQQKNIFALFDGDIKNNICTRLRSARGGWSIANEDYETFKEFSNKTGVVNYSINAVQYPELNAFLKESRIINSVPVPLCEQPNDLEGVHHIDVKKAYTQHKYAPFYKGFLGHITNWRKGNFNIDFLSSHLGIYQFRILNNSSELLKQLGLCVGKSYTLPSPEIQYFVSLGLTVQIVAGCWGSSFDFEYTDEMLENRRYCTWAGKLGSDKSYDSYTMLNQDKEWVGHLKSSLGDDNVIHFGDFGMTVVKINKKSYSTKHHILAFITSYTRMNMIKLMGEVLKQSSLGNGSLVKVVMDGLYFRGEMPDIDIPHHTDKDLKEHRCFKDTWYHPSDINTSTWSTYSSDFDGSCVLAGAGGSGKSYSVFTDKGLIKPLYVVPSHILGRKMRNDFGCQYTTIHRLIGAKVDNIPCRAYKEDHKEPGCIFIDELTMIEADWINTAIKMYPNTMFLIGGDINEKQWFQCRSGSKGKYSKIWRGEGWRFVHYRNDYRSKDIELKEMKEWIRSQMRTVFTDGGMRDAYLLTQSVKTKYTTISFLDAVKQFQKYDTWIAGTHKTNEMLLNLNVVSGGLTKDKEIVRSDMDGIESRGSFTIHSFQGLTINEGKVFISLNDCFEYAMLYTAVSRCVHFSQIVLVL